MNRSILCVFTMAVASLGIGAVASAQDWINVRINEDATVELQNEQQVVVNPTDPSNLVAVWRDFRLGYRQVGYGFTNNRGVTWTNPGLFVDVHYARDSDPALTVNAEGDFFAMLLAYTGDTSQPNGMLMFRSVDGGQTWEDRGFAVNGVPGVFEDKEFIACDRTSSPYHGRIYMAWTRFWETNIYCVLTDDEGDTWTSERLVSDVDGNQFPTPAVGHDGTVYVAWTNFFSSSIQIDRAFDGESFGSDRLVTSVYDPDPTINGNISTPAHPAMDVDISGGEYHGRIYVAYLSREGSSDYDIFIRHSDDQAETWSDSRRINDDEFNNGRDQFHPWLTVDNLGIVSVIWLDRRHDPNNRNWHCYVSQSLDGGMTWSANQQVSTEDSDPADAAIESLTRDRKDPPAPTIDENGTRAGLIGEYIGIACWDGYITPVWTDTRNGHQDTYGGARTATAVEDDESAPLIMLRASPNPSSGHLTIGFSVPEDGWITLDLYDVAGRYVRTLVDRNVQNGTHEFLWNGTDQSGRRVAAGTYLLRLKTATAGATRTVTFWR
jgi:hypothetical protein